VQEGGEGLAASKFDAFAADERGEQGEQGEQVGGGSEEWQIASFELAERRGLLRLDTIHVPEHYLHTSRQPPAPAPREYIGEAAGGLGGGGASAMLQGRVARRAEQLRALACCEILVLPWREASQPGSILIMGRLLARRSCSALMPPCDAPGYSCSSPDKDSSVEVGRERAFSFKVLLTGVPRGDGGALPWLADKINRKLDVSRWRSFIAVARRRIRMQRPQHVDAAFLSTIGREAVQELDLRAAEMPDEVDIELLLASRALDDDWLTRPNLQLQLNDMRVLHYLVEADAADLGAHPEAHDVLGGDGAAAGRSDTEARSAGGKAQVAPGFSVLRDVALDRAGPEQDGAVEAPGGAEQPAPALEPAVVSLTVPTPETLHLEQHSVSSAPAPCPSPH